MEVRQERRRIPEISDNDNDRRLPCAICLYRTILVQSGYYKCRWDKLQHILYNAVDIANKRCTGLHMDRFVSGSLGIQIVPPLSVGAAVPGQHTGRG